MEQGGRRWRRVEEGGRGWKRVEASEGEFMRVDESRRGWKREGELKKEEDVGNILGTEKQTPAPASSHLMC